MDDRSPVIIGLARKQREIVGAIRAYEAQIAQAKHDLAHINAALKILEGSEPNKRTYIAGRSFFDKGEIAAIAQRHLAQGPLNTRQIAERVMVEKELDPTDTALRNSVVYKTVQALRQVKRRRKVRMVEKQGGMCLWALGEP
ncbi:MAG TPA: hypothetical protein VGN97_00770 [Mesorhizobium sp.]|jgi:hypothetical protein|nr:hypothetical protein [Mesorhizobium sp.]